MTRPDPPRAVRILAAATGILLGLVGLSSVVGGVFQIVSILAGNYGGSLTGGLLILLLGAGLIYVAQWLLMNGATPGYEAQTRVVFKLFALVLILAGVFGGGCALVMAGYAVGGDPYATVGVILGCIVGVVCLSLGFLFWKAVKGLS